MNDYLKELGELQIGLAKNETKRITKGGNAITVTKPKFRFLSSHCARRSFCTNQYQLGVDTITIMGISGHKNLVTFMKYLKVTPTQHAEKLQTIWANKNNLRVA